MGASTPLRRRTVPDWSSCPPGSWEMGRSWLFEELVLIMSNIKTQQKQRSKTPHTSWRNNFLPEAWTKEKKQEKGDYQSENYHKLVSQSPVKETGATGELQMPDPRVTAARHGYQLIPVSLETFLRAEHLEFLPLLLLLHSKTKLRPWLHHAVFSVLINTAPDHRKTNSSVASSSCSFLTGCFYTKLQVQISACMHAEKEMHGCVGIAICACSRIRFLYPNPAAMSHGVATIK
jgi:hypothetical protein